MSAGATILRTAQPPSTASSANSRDESRASLSRGRVVIATLNRRAGDTGVHTHTRVLQAGLVGSGVECAVVSPFDAGAHWLGVFAVRRLIHPFNRTASLGWYRRWHRAALRRALLRHLSAHPADVVLAQCPVSAAAALDVRRQLKGTFLVAMVCHFNRSEATEYRDRGELKHPAAFLDMLEFERRVLEQVDHVIYVSRWASEVVEGERGIQPRKSSIIWNGIPNEREAEADQGLNYPCRSGVTAESRHEKSGPHPSPLPAYREREHGGWGRREPQQGERRQENNIILINVGTLEARKNQLGLVMLFAEIAPRFPSAVLMLVGEGPDRARIEQRIDALKLAGRVQLLGHRQDVAALLREADIYLHFAAMENCPIALIEAARAGLPIAAVPSGGVAELLSAFDGVAIDASDHAASVERLAPLLAHADVRRARGRRAREGFLRSFTCEAMVQAYVTALGLAPAREIAPGEEEPR